MRWLVGVFGLPSYSSFDPSPFLLLNFYLFFGICFSDIGYGLMLGTLAVYIMVKGREFEGLYTFGKLLFFGALSTIVFGALLGSFFSNLYYAEYLGEGNPILLVMQKITVLDPLAKPLIALSWRWALEFSTSSTASALRFTMRSTKATILRPSLTACSGWLSCRGSRL